MERRYFIKLFRGRGLGREGIYQRWLDPENEDVADIVATPPSEGWIAYPVSRRVNSPKNDDAKLIEPEPA